jgi:hypothetical protein
MTPSRLCTSNPIDESGPPLPEGDATSFGILSGTQEADLRTKLPLDLAINPSSGQPGPDGDGLPAAARPPGRPRLIDDAKREKILAMLENGFSQPICAAHVGVSLRTLRREMARDAEFRERALRAETLFEQWPLMTIIRAARNNWRAASWLLANMPHVSVRRRKREEQRKETQPAATMKGLDPMIAMLAQPCMPKLGRGK